jgi:hypothetical protein
MNYNNDYYIKYMKYKTKYIAMQNSMYGGVQPSTVYSTSSSALSPLFPIPSASSADSPLFPIPSASSADSSLFPIPSASSADSSLFPIPSALSPLPAQSINSDRIFGPEDPRLFVLNNEYYLLYNNINNNTERIRHMYIRKINMGNYKPYNTDIELCKSNSTAFEKNWGPFELDNQLYLIYTISPLKIMRYNKGTLSNCTIIYNEPVPIFTYLEKLYSKVNLHIRNSSPLIKYYTDDNKEYFLGIGHSVMDFKEKKDHIQFFMRNESTNPYNETDADYFTQSYNKLYHTFFYTVECLPNNNFQIKSITPMFHFENKYDHLIEFACDLTIVDNDIVYIGYGVDDNKGVIEKMYLSDILRMMMNCETINSSNYTIDSYFLSKTNYFLQEKIRTYDFDITNAIHAYFPGSTIFNIGIKYDKNKDFLVCCRRYYDGDIRRWDGTNSIVLLHVTLDFENFIKNKPLEIKVIWEVMNNLNVKRIRLTI